MTSLPYPKHEMHEPWLAVVPAGHGGFSFQKEREAFRKREEASIQKKEEKGWCLFINNQPTAYAKSLAGLRTKVATLQLPTKGRREIRKLYREFSR